MSPSTFCEHYNTDRCRSCEWLEIDYPKQLQQKEARLREALGLAADFALEPTLPSAPQGFRNRVKLSVTGTIEAPVIGLLGKTDLDQGRELLDCPIHHPRLNELMSALPPLLREHAIAPYRIAERRGELKGLIAFYSGEMYLRFVVRSEESIPRLRRLVPALQARFPELVCVSANLQPIPHAILEGPTEIFLTERTTIDYRLGDLTLKLSPRAFVQTHGEAALSLYQTAAHWIGELHPGRLLELYCGQGAFSFFAAKSADAILGVELNAEAVQAANTTARERGLTHVLFKAAEVTRVRTEVLDFKPELILANPPRRGLGEAVGLIQAALPRHLIYSSCAIDTLAADLRKLSSAYRLRRARIFDLFPHTEHFETLAWLERI